MLEWRNTGKGGEMTGKNQSEGLSKNESIWSSDRISDWWRSQNWLVEVEVEQLQIWLINAFSCDFWIVLGLNFQIRVVSSLDQV